MLSGTIVNVYDRLGLSDDADELVLIADERYGTTESGAAYDHLIQTVIDVPIHCVEIELSAEKIAVESIILLVRWKANLWYISLSKQNQSAITIADMMRLFG
jgi:hypothetical protein